MQIKNKDNEYVDICNETLVSNLLHNLYINARNKYNAALDKRNIAGGVVFSEITLTLRKLNRLEDVVFKYIGSNLSYAKLLIDVLTELNICVNEYINPFTDYIGITLGTNVTVEITLSNNSITPSTACSLTYVYENTVVEGEDKLPVSELPKGYIADLNGDQEHLYTVDTSKSHYTTFKIYRITEWTMDADVNPKVVELVLSGSMKWDGCSEFHWRCGHTCSWLEQVKVQGIIKEITKITALHVTSYDCQDTILALGIEDEYNLKLLKSE